MGDLSNALAKVDLAGLPRDSAACDRALEHMPTAIGNVTLKSVTSRLAQYSDLSDVISTPISADDNMPGTFTKQMVPSAVQVDAHSSSGPVIWYVFRPTPSLGMPYSAWLGARNGRCLLGADGHSADQAVSLLLAAVTSAAPH